MLLIFFWLPWLYFSFRCNMYIWNVLLYNTVKDIRGYAFRLLMLHGLLYQYAKIKTTMKNGCHSLQFFIFYFSDIEFFLFFPPCDASVSIYCKGGRERARLLDWKNVLDVSQEIWTSPLLYAIRKKIRVRTIEPQTLCVSKRKKGIYAYLQIFAWFIETG